MRCLLVEWHYKMDCPYCDRFERYVLNPLEEMGLVKVIRVCLTGLMHGPSISENIKISRIIEGSSVVAAPLLIDLTGKERSYFLPFSPQPGAAVEDAVRVMAENFIKHLCRKLRMRYEEVTSHPLIRKALLLDRDARKRKIPKIWGVR